MTTDADTTAAFLSSGTKIRELQDEIRGMSRLEKMNHAGRLLNGLLYICQLQADEIECLKKRMNDYE